MSLTGALADWAANLRYDRLPEIVVSHIHRGLTDYTACALVGASTAVVVTLREYLFHDAPGGLAPVVGSSRRLSARDAAFVNGTAAHALEIDDGHTRGSLHPGATIIPAVMATAALADSTHEELITALAAGTEVACRVAAAGHPATWERGFHNTPLAGVMGAACGVAQLRRAAAPAIVSAMGLAASHAGGLFAFINAGADVKQLHAGKAARDGLISAELALRAVHGPDSILEGERGYFHAFADGHYDPHVLVDDLGSAWELLGTYIKPYPCCRHLHAPVEAILRLVARDNVEAGAVNRVIVETHAIAASHNHTRITTLLDAQLSIPYAVAVALQYGTVTLDQFAPRTRIDPAVHALVGRVDVRASDRFSRMYPASRPATVTVILDSGRHLSETVHTPYGEPSRPISDSAMMAKFNALCLPAAGEARCRQIWELLQGPCSARELTRSLAFDVAADPRFGAGAQAVLGDVEPRVRDAAGVSCL